MLNLPFFFHSNDELNQKQWIRQRLIEHGSITRNECLRRYISRLATRIFELKNEGMDIVGERMYQANGKAYDFIYRYKGEVK